MRVSDLIPKDLLKTLEVPVEVERDCHTQQHPDYKRLDTTLTAIEDYVIYYKQVERENEREI